VNLGDLANLGQIIGAIVVVASLLYVAYPDAKPISRPVRERKQTHG